MFGKIFSPKKENLTKKVEWTYKEIKEAIEIKWKDRTCECCGNTNWSITEDVFQHSFHDPKLYKQCYILILVCCDYCGNAKQFRPNTLCNYRKILQLN